MQWRPLEIGICWSFSVCGRSCVQKSLHIAIDPIAQLYIVERMNESDFAEFHSDYSKRGAAYFERVSTQWFNWLTWISATAAFSYLHKQTGHIIFGIVWGISFLLITNYSLKLVCSFPRLWKMVAKIKLPRSVAIILTVSSVALINHLVIYTALTAIETSQWANATPKNAETQ